MVLEKLRAIWKGHKSWVQIGAFILLAALALVIPFGQARVCSVSKVYSSPATYRVTIDRPNRRQAKPQAENAPVTQFSFGPSVDSGVGEEDHTEASYYAAQEEENWGRKFWCDINASDYFLVMFTLWLAVSTFFLWRETERLAKGAVRQSEDMTRSIREQRRTALANIVSARAARKAAAAADRHATAAVGAEVPLLHIVSCKPYNTRGSEKEQWFRGLFLAFQIKNFGRTAALVTELVVNMRVGHVPDSPPHLVSNNNYPTAVAIEAGKEATFNDLWGYKCLDEAQIQEWLADPDECLFVYGAIKYSDFSGIHEQGWVFIWVRANLTFASFEQKTAYYYKT